MFPATKKFGASLSRSGVPALSLVLALFSAILWDGPAQAGKRVALVIGNADYRASNWARLPNAVNDATDIAAALGRLGFAVTSLKNAGKAQTVRSLGRFSEVAAGAELALIFYAGHSIEIDKRNFLIPVDASAENPGSVAREAVPLERLLRAGSTADGLRLVLLDACRDNPFAGKIAPGKTAYAVGVGLGPPADVSGEILVAYAAKAGTQASDGVGRNSPYTAALRYYLEQPGLEVGLLLRFVRDAVVAASQGEQQPFVYGSQSARLTHFKPPLELASPSARLTGPASVEERLDLTQRQRRRIQVALWAQGFNPGLPTGRFDGRTREKIAEWQSYYGRNGTGFLDREAVDSLLAEISDPSGPVWLNTVDHSCTVWVARPEAGVMTAAWSGDCVAGKASGQGRLLLKSNLGEWAFEGKMGDGVLRGRSTMNIVRGPMKGSQYDGEWKNSRYHGHGILTLPNGSQYDGEWHNGARHGFGKLTFPDGSQYAGEWQNGVMYGSGKLTFPDGGGYEGKWRNGLWHGFGKLIFSDGGYYKGIFRDGKPARRGIVTFSGGVHYRGELNEMLSPHGQGRLTFNNGSSYLGGFKNGLFHGNGVYKLPDGQRYEGEWYRNKYHGSGKLKYSNGSLYEGEFYNGKWHGSGKYVRADGFRYEGKFKNGRFHGYGNGLFTDGSRYEGEWRNGVWQGFGIYNFGDGIRYTGMFRNGRKHGRGTKTYPNGDRYVGEFRNNTYQGQGILTESGTRYEGDFHDGLYHGQGRLIYSEGSRYEGQFRFGGRYGAGALTLPDGTRFRGEYKFGGFRGDVVVTWLKGKHKGKRAVLKVLPKATKLISIHWPDGRKYSGEIRDYDPHGSGTMIWSNGGVYEGIWRDGKPHGNGIYTGPGKRVYEGDWREGCFGIVDSKRIFLATTAEACGFD